MKDYHILSLIIGFVMFAAGVGLMYYSYHDSHKHKITVKGRYIFNQTFNKKDITFEDKSMISSCRFIDCKITIKGTSSFYWK